jgi:hypothetical protein
VTAAASEDARRRIEQDRRGAPARAGGAVASDRELALAPSVHDRDRGVRHALVQRLDLSPPRINSVLSSWSRRGALGPPPLGHASRARLALGLGDVRSAQRFAERDDPAQVIR